MHKSSGWPGIFSPHSCPSPSMCVDALPARKWHQEHLVPSLRDPAGQVTLHPHPSLWDYFSSCLSFSLLLDDSCLFLCFPITLLGWTLASLASSCGFSASWLAGDRGRSVSAPVLGTVPFQVRWRVRRPCLPPGTPSLFQTFSQVPLLPALPRLPGGREWKLLAGVILQVLGPRSKTLLTQI